MKCAFCDAELNDGALTCSKCGKDVQLVPDYNEFDEDYLNGLIGTLSEVDKREEAKAKAKAKKKKKAMLQKQKNVRIKKTVLIVSVVLFIVAVIVVIVGIKHTIDNKNYNSVSYQLNKAQEAVQARNWDEAILYFDRALVLDGDNVDTMLSMAEIYAEVGDVEAEIAYLKQIRTVEPGNEQAIKRLISIYDADQDYDSILEMYYSVSDNPGLTELFSEYITPDPAFNISSGDYSEAITVSISSEDNDVIYYTIDGQNPKEFGDTYSEELVFSEEGEYEVQAVCVNKLGIYSNVISQRYNILFETPEMPVVTPDGGSFVSGTQITIEVPEDCSAYYLWGSDTPSPSSKHYTGPFYVPEGNNVLSVIIYNNSTGKCSEIYRGRFEYYK